jgi:2-octaprenylphenol hydroxylase
MTLFPNTTQIPYSEMGSATQTSYDVIIVGAGMVGASAACLLAQTNPNLTVALVEAQRSTPFNPQQFDP